jgi:orotidine-5'-phosphate decarboxylase
MPDHTERLIVALDLPDIAAASAIADLLLPVVSTFKIGYSLMFEPGFHTLVEQIRDADKTVFLDAKLHDIPETVKRGVRSAAKTGLFEFITVHSTDEKMLRAAMDGADGHLKILAVTALTSLSGHGVRERFQTGVANAARAACDGLIMSPTDLTDDFSNLGHRPPPGSAVSMIRSLVGNMIIATPGVRLPGSPQDDQSRVGTPQQAIANGADYIIVGRPIVLASDPLAAAMQFVAAVAEVDNEKGA